MLKKIIHSTIIAYVWLAFLPLALAQTRPPIIPTQETIEQLMIPRSPVGVAEETYFGGTFLPTLTRTIIAMAGVTAVLFIIIGGVQILTAYGNDEKIGKAKKTITFAIIGLLIAILSYAIVSIISAINLTPTQ
jgi:FtsH-binding integral membrane protein